MITLRPYQQNLRHWFNQMLNNGRHPVGVMPTASGKTKTGTVVIEDRISLGKRLLVLCHQDIIFNQWISEFANIGLKYGYINDEGIIGRNRDVYVCMVQSLDNMLFSLPEKFIKSFSEILADECHHNSAATWRNIYDMFSHCLRFGLTATPYRMDNRPLGEFYTDMYEPITMSESIASGYLCKPVIIVPEEYRDNIPQTADDVNPDDNREYVKEKQIIGDMVKLYGDVFNGLPVIVPCTTHAHAESVTDMFSSAGWFVDHIHSKMATGERSGIIRRVSSGKTNLLVTVGIGIEGMDIPGLYGIIWMRYTESLTIWMQFNGRAMRPAPGKEFFVMIDTVGNSVIHGTCDIDRKWSLDSGYIPGQDIESDAPMSRICPVCSVANSTDNMKCWICDYDFITGLLNGEEIDKKKRKLPKIIDGKLIYLDGGHDANFNSNCNNNSDSDNVRNFTISNENDKKYIHSRKQGTGEHNTSKEQEEAELTRAEKMEILSKDLIGLKSKTKFREGVGWL